MDDNGNTLLLRLIIICQMQLNEVFCHLLHKIDFISFWLVFYQISFGTYIGIHRFGFTLKNNFQQNTHVHNMI